MATSTSVASVLVTAELPSSEVAAVVAAKSTRRDGVIMPTPPPAAAAKHLAKASVAAAITFASSVIDEDYLAKAAKDPRITVRRAVAANAHTPEPSRQYLLDWAIHKNDAELADNLAPYIDVDHAITRVSEVTHNASQFFSKLAQRIALANDPELMSRAVATYWPDLCHRLGTVIAGVRPSNISVTAVISQARECSDARLARKMLTNILYSADVVDVELAELALEDPEATTPLESFTGIMSDAAITRLLESDDAHIITYVGWALTSQNRVSKELGEVPVNETLLNVFLDKVDQNAVRPLSRISAAGLTTPAAVRLIELTVKLTKSLEPDRYLADRNTEPPMPLLPTAALITVLGFSRNTFGQRWLSGTLQQDPRPGEVALLIKDALANNRKTFSAHYIYYTSAGEASVREIAQALPLESYLNKPWSDELVDCLGPAVFDRLGNDISLRDYVVHRVSSIIGIAPGAWEMFFGLIENYSGSMVDLLTTTRRLLKINGEEIILPAHLELPLGQLSLL